MMYKMVCGCTTITQNDILYNPFNDSLDNFCYEDICDYFLRKNQLVPLINFLSIIPKYHIMYVINYTVDLSFVCKTDLTMLYSNFYKLEHFDILNYDINKLINKIISHNKKSKDNNMTSVIFDLYTKLMGVSKGYDNFISYIRNIFSIDLNKIENNYEFILIASILTYNNKILSLLLEKNDLVNHISQYIIDNVKNFSALYNNKIYCAFLSTYETNSLTKLILDENIFIDYYLNWKAIDLNNIIKHDIAKKWINDHIYELLCKFYFSETTPSKHQVRGFLRILNDATMQSYNLNDITEKKATKIWIELFGDIQCEICGYPETYCFEKCNNAKSIKRKYDNHDENIRYSKKIKSNHDSII